MTLCFRNNMLMKEAVKTLNILYTYDKTYEPYLILWLFPLQVCFIRFIYWHVKTLHVFES